MRTVVKEDMNEAKKKGRHSVAPAFRFIFCCEGRKAHYMILNIL
jgi:hypothetical protein